MKMMRSAFIGIAAYSLCTLSVQSLAAPKSGGAKRPVLYEFIQQVTADHPALRAAEATLRAVRARAKGQSRPLYNPEIAFDFENAEVNTQEIGLSQTLDWGGKRRARTNVGTAQVSAAEAAFEIARKSLLTDILQALADYQTAAKILGVAAERESLSSEFLALAVRQHEAGTMPRAELLTAQLALAEARVAKNETAGGYSVAEERLIAVVGEDRGIWPKLNGVPTAETRPAGRDPYLQVPELRLAQAQTSVSRARIKVAKTERKPDPTVGVRFGEEGRSTLLGLSLSIPLPVRNNYKSAVVAAGADLIAAQQRYYAINSQVKARIDASIKRYDGAAAAWQQWQSYGAEPLSEQRALLEKLIQARQISALNYLIQLNQTFTTETASIELNGRLWNAWFDRKNADATIGTWLETLQ